MPTDYSVFGVVYVCGWQGLGASLIKTFYQIECPTPDQISLLTQVKLYFLPNFLVIIIRIYCARSLSMVLNNNLVLCCLCAARISKLF